MSAPNTVRPDPQAALPGMEPAAPAKRFETTMVDAMPVAWECPCGKRSRGRECWNCGRGKPAATALPSPDCSTLCAPSEGRCSITADGRCDALDRGGAS